MRLEVYTQQSSVLLNNTDGTFSMKALPAAAQLSPMYGIAVDDFDGDGRADILMGGNFYQTKPEVGIYDASYGVFLKGKGNGEFDVASSQESELNVRGQVRNISSLKAGKDNLLIIAVNNGPLRILKSNEKKSATAALAKQNYQKTGRRNRK